WYGATPRSSPRARQWVVRNRGSWDSFAEVHGTEARQYTGRVKKAGTAAYGYPGTPGGARLRHMDVPPVPRRFSACAAEVQSACGRLYRPESRQEGGFRDQ